MKKILFFFAATCAFVACDPVQEDFSNGGHISLDELKAKTTISVDKAESGANGNVIECYTAAPVNARWDIDDKDFKSTYAWKKMKLGEHIVKLTALCTDGTILTYDTTLVCQEVTNPLTKYYLYGEDPEKEPAVTVGSWAGGALRFSSDEGQFLPTISDAIYDGCKTLIFDLSDVADGTTYLVNNGWWSSTYFEGLSFQNGLNEFTITKTIADECAKGHGGKDMQIIITNGQATFNSVYYEE